jgi:hypothetical protein
MSSLPPTTPASSQPSERDPGSLPRHARLRSIRALSLSVLFLVMIWLPLLDSAYRLDPSTAPVENRRLTPFPTLVGGVGGLKDYLAGLEAYFSDYFGFRNFLIRARGYLHWRWLGQGEGHVLVGRENWLFYGAKQSLDSHMGLHSLSAKQLRNWQLLLEERRAWLARRGMKYLFVVVPDKESIYPEYLPGWASRSHAPSDLDQLLAHLRAHSSIEILDLRPALRSAKTNGWLYLATDTHWNGLGAFAAYQEIMRRLGGQLPGLEPMQLDAFEVRRLPYRGGDLARMLAQEQSIAEPQCLILAPRPPLEALEAKPNPLILPKPWSPGEEPIFVDNPAQKHKAVIFRDSFASLLTPFFGYHFKRTVLIWQRAWDTNVIQREQPDVVIDEILERFLDVPVDDLRQEPTPGNLGPTRALARATERPTD